ncbi:MAG: T9SS type A sorting domain-containing protein, partial [Saprospiraceae bacterium]|nr:T9SS type A sorting domain-containing protein [Saprospiraceae bacterium]
IQGVMGHGFDNSKTNPSAWIISPVAGGGYPWNNYTATGTLMIRPVFKASAINVSVVENRKSYDLQVYPNPAVHGITLTTPDASIHDGFVQIFDATGKLYYEASATSLPIILSVAQLPPGAYMLRLTTKEGIGVRWFVKH